MGVLQESSLRHTEPASWPRSLRKPDASLAGRSRLHTISPAWCATQGSLGSKKGLIIKKDFFPELQWGTGTVRVKDGWLHKDHPKGN